MDTKIGIGYSKITSSRDAGVQAAMAALSDGCIDRADFALVFCGGKHNPYEFLEGDYRGFAGRSDDRWLCNRTYYRT